jgi:Asp-tRNA(Asn)/Glu-tRNA(Gln) amidotransferase A subunit family amidase
MVAEGASVFAELQRHQRGRISERLNALIDEGRGIARASLSQALVQRDQLAEDMDAFLSRFDAIITPPAPGEAPADLSQTGDPAFCTIWSLCGVPAITVPAGEGPRGLPLGLQLIGPRLADNRLLSIAHWCDGIIGWTKRIAG